MLSLLRVPSLSCLPSLLRLCMSVFSLHHLQTFNVGGTLVTKCEFWRISCTIEVSFLGVRMKWKLLKVTCFQKQLWKTKLWSRWCTRKSKFSADCAQGWEVNKIQLKLTKVVLSRVTVNQMCLWNPVSRPPERFSTYKNASNVHIGCGINYPLLVQRFSVSL